MRRTAFSIVVTALVTLTSVVHADRQVAIKYFRAGEKAYLAQNFGTAAENFYEAYKALPLPEIAFSAAQAYRRQYRVEPKREYVERAVELYRAYLDQVKNGGRVGDAADSLDAMERELEKLGGMRKVKERSDFTRLGVTVSLGGVTGDNAMKEIDDTKMGAPSVAVTATLDGKQVDPETMIDLAVGDHIFRAEAKGFIAGEKKARAVQGQSNWVDLALAPQPAHVTIATEPRARVSIDGRGIGIAPFASVELAAGRHVITMVRDGRQPIAREIIVTRGEDVTVTQPLVPTARRRAVKWVVVGAGALTVASAASAIAAIVEDGRASDKLAKLHMGSQDAAVLRDYQTIKTRRDQLVATTWTTGGAALAVGATALVLYYFDTPSAEGLRVIPMVVPTVSATGAGVRLSGQF